MQFEEQAKEALTAAADVFDESEGTVDKQLVFSRSRHHSTRRLVSEHEADGYVIPNPLQSEDRILLAIDDDATTENIERLSHVAGGLFAGAQEILLYVVGDDES